MRTHKHNTKVHLPFLMSTAGASFSRTDRGATSGGDETSQAEASSAKEAGANDLGRIQQQGGDAFMLELRGVSRGSEGHLEGEPVDHRLLHGPHIAQGLLLVRRDVLLVAFLPPGGGPKPDGVRGITNNP